MRLKGELVLIETRCPWGQPPSVLGEGEGEGEGERKERVGWVGHTGREESLVGPGEHSEPFIQHEAGE